MLTMKAKQTDFENNMSAAMYVALVLPIWLVCWYACSNFQRDGSTFYSGVHASTIGSRMSPEFAKMRSKRANLCRRHRSSATDHVMDVPWFSCAGSAKLVVASTI